MSKDFMLTERNVVKILYLIEKLEVDKILADKLRDNGAYNRICALKINLNEYLKYFAKRIEKSKNG